METASVECLVQLGFSLTEARVFCTMVSEDKMNGYQIAKILGISRSSVYAALENLLDKGAIVSIPGQTSEYAVVEPSQLIDKLTSKFKKNAITARDMLESLSLKRRASNYFCNVHGFQNLADEIRCMINSAKKEVLIDCEMELGPFAESLKDAKARGVRIIVFSWINLDLHGIDLEFYTNALGSVISDGKRFIMVVDNASCIMCSNDRNEFIPISAFTSDNPPSLPTEDKDFLGIKSDNRLMVSVLQEHIHFDIYLNKLRKKTGGEIITPDIRCNTLMETGN